MRKRRETWVTRGVKNQFPVCWCNVWFYPSLYYKPLYRIINRPFLGGGVGLTTWCNALWLTNTEYERKSLNMVENHNCQMMLCISGIKSVLFVRKLANLVKELKGNSQNCPLQILVHFCFWSITVLSAMSLPDTYILKWCFNKKCFMYLCF